MASKVGPKGQVVIAKEIRDRLGVQPGWLAVQMLVNDHVEIYFIPPEHNRSLLGVLAPHTDVRIDTEEELNEAIEKTMAQAAVERFKRSMNSGQ